MTALTIGPYYPGRWPKFFAAMACQRGNAIDQH
jgi:hypothetical protein